jgi:hypothetical protein
MRRVGTLFSALTLATVTLATVTLGTAAQAAPAPAPANGTAISADEQRTAERYWTPERLRSAQDVTTLPAARAARLDTGPTVGRKATVPPVQGPAAANPSAPSVRATSPTAWTGGGLISTTAGKVFFNNASGGTFACSATVANSDNRSVVLTAGHCTVDAATGTGYRNWVFIPGYNNGNRPFGTFTARRLFWEPQYVSTKGNANWDYAWAVMNTVNGRTLVDTVGAQGVVFNSATSRRVHSFGYGGSAAEGNGERLNHCEGDAFPDPGRPGSTMWGIDCVQTGGSSGGGFLADFSGGGGYLLGNISVSAGQNEYYPTLGNEALTLYRQAGAA